MNLESANKIKQKEKNTLKVDLKVINLRNQCLRLERVDFNQLDAKDSLALETLFLEDEIQEVI